MWGKEFWTKHQIIPCNYPHVFDALAASPERRSSGDSRVIRTGFLAGDWDRLRPLRSVFVPWHCHPQMSWCVPCGQWSVSVTCVPRKWPICSVRHKGLETWWRNTSVAPRSPFPSRFVNQSAKEGLMVCFIKLSAFFPLSNRKRTLELQGAIKAK